ncbi:MAG: pyridoxal phosphate-dependent aminotransferase [Flavobacteriaceae bacterium TMED121]|nr:MAG: pyridoxal phosphate-dependent aminotransferase [Flavobacteriaceae bacterium TMED121]
MPKISKKAQELPSSPIRKLVTYADQAKSRGVEILHLNIGQPDIEAPSEAMEIVRHHDFKLLPYGSSQGALSYRQKLCTYYEHHDINIHPNDIIVTTGASEALSFTLNVICDAGDEIIIPEPFYANYNGFAASSSVKVIPVISHFDNKFELPPVKDLKEKITNKTRAILICNPSNPTGYLYTEIEIKALVDLAVEKDIFIIVDEVYREFIYTDSPHYSVLQNKKGSQHAVMIDSVSKRYSLCGARVGCMISKNKRLMATALKFAHLRLSPPALALMASEAAITAPHSYLEAVKKEYSIRRKVTIEALEKIKDIKVSKPMGAFYCIAKLPVKSAEDFSKFLLTDFQDDRQTVMLAPASGFYSSPELGKDQVRLAFVLESSKLKRAAKILEKALIVYNN